MYIFLYIVIGLSCLLCLGSTLCTMFTGYILYSAIKEKDAEFSWMSALVFVLTIIMTAFCIVVTIALCGAV